MKLLPLRLAGDNFWPKQIHPSCQILTNLALCALLKLFFFSFSYYVLKMFGTQILDLQLRPLFVNLFLCNLRFTCHYTEFLVEVSSS